MNNASQMVNYDLATQILDLFEEVIKESSQDIAIHFEELTAEPGPLPRLMLSPQQNSTSQGDPGYLSGEAAYPFPCTLTLRVSAEDEQDRLDADAYLRELTTSFINRASVLKSYVAYRKPAASIPSCLGRTSAFEDWRVTFDLNYICQ